MERREAIQYISLLLGGTLVGANALLTGCTSGDKKAADANGKLAFTQEDTAMLDEVAETILPTTSTPGAKAAKVGAFMTVMVNDCYEPRDQKVFHEGLKKLNDASDKAYKYSFMQLKPEQRHELLVKLDAEQKEHAKNKKEDEAQHYFRMMKELTLLGYFTSEIGTTQARRYAPVPGKYEGCVPYTKGEKAWA